MKRYSTVQTTETHHFTSIGMVKTKKTVASADGAVEKPESSDNTSRDIKWYRHLEGGLAVFLKLNIKLVYDSASLLLDMYTKAKLKPMSRQKLIQVGLW